MPQDTTFALSGLASFELLEGLLAARGIEGSPEAMMTFEGVCVADERKTGMFV